MSIATDPTTEQLIAELYKIDGKAEIVGGRIVMMSPTGDMPGSAGGSDLRAACEHMRSSMAGEPIRTTLHFLVDLPNRKVVLPRTRAYYTGPRAR